MPYLQKSNKLACQSNQNIQPNTEKVSHRVPKIDLFNLNQCSVDYLTPQSSVDEQP